MTMRWAVRSLFQSAARERSAFQARRQTIVVLAKMMKPMLLQSHGHEWALREVERICREIQRAKRFSQLDDIRAHLLALHASYSLPAIAWIGA